MRVMEKGNASLPLWELSIVLTFLSKKRVSDNLNFLGVALSGYP